MADHLGEDQHDENEAITRLRQVANRVDPVPDDVIAAAKASFTWRTIDAELAELAFDSLVDDQELVGVRGGPGDAGDSRLLTFDSPHLSIELEVLADRDGRRLVGQLVPPQGATVAVQMQQANAGGGEGDAGEPSGTLTVTADALGRFAARSVPAGLIRLLVTPESPEQAGVTTAWFTI